LLLRSSLESCGNIDNVFPIIWLAVSLWYNVILLHDKSNAHKFENFSNVGAKLQKLSQLIELYFSRIPVRYCKILLQILMPNISGLIS
jgi:hypothetical protein